MVNGVELAALRDPQFAEMFWTSLEIVPSTDPADPRLADDEFWWRCQWQLIDASTDREAPLAVASAAGLQGVANRVTMRGLHTT